mgnify:CR=1 FL=1
MAFIRSDDLSVRDTLIRLVCRTSRRFWPWWLAIRRVGLGIRIKRLSLLERHRCSTRRTSDRANTPGAQKTACFRRDLARSFTEAGWPIKRVLTDRGSEFKADFNLACEDLEITHTRTKPRRPWTNGFVERLQSTIFHEHWRIAFRRRYFTT